MSSNAIARNLCGFIIEIIVLDPPKIEMATTTEKIPHDSSVYRIYLSPLTQRCLYMPTWPNTIRTREHVYVLALALYSVTRPCHNLFVLPLTTYHQPPSPPPYSNTFYHPQSYCATFHFLFVCKRRSIRTRERERNKDAFSADWPAVPNYESTKAFIAMTLTALL